MTHRTPWRTAEHGRHSIAPVIAFVALSLPLTGCSVIARATGRTEAPAMQLAASKVESVSVATVGLAFELIVHNPNSYTLTSHALRYRLTVNQTELAAGDIDVAVPLPPMGHATLRLPLEVRLDQLRNAAPAAMVVGEIPYELEVWLSIDSWFRQREVHLLAPSVLRMSVPLGLAHTEWLPSPSEAAKANDANHQECATPWVSISQRSTRRSPLRSPTANASCSATAASVGENSTGGRGSSPTS